MSWDPNAGGGYDNYGNYGYDASTGQGQQQQQQGQQQGYGADPNQQQGYDMSGGGGGGGYSDYGQQQHTNPQQQQQQQQQGYFDPNSQAGYGQQQQQQRPAPSGYQAQNAYRSTPTPQGAPVPQQQQQPASFAFPGMADSGVNPMVANMAMEYGQNIVGKGGEELKKNLDKYVSIGQLKYYFAVDTTYVGKKLGLLLFPFTRSDWSVRYSQDEPVQPKFDVNAPDLYIPCMAYVTYVLIVGYILGLRDAFSPDLLASTASSCLAWLVLELGVIYLTLTLMNIATNLCKWDILSFSTYKYVAMIAILLSGLVMQSKAAYYAVLLYVSGALAFFLVRTLKLRIGPEVHGMQVHGKRKLYMILFYSGLQPLFIWWMTSYLVPISSQVEMPIGMPPMGDMMGGATPEDAMSAGVP